MEKLMRASEEPRALAPAKQATDQKLYFQARNAAANRLARFEPKPTPPPPARPSPIFKYSVIQAVKKVVGL